MWTPRRILILLTTLFGFGVVYAAYARFLGRIDGLPKLPDKYLEYDSHALPERPVAVSPTLVRLREAFGENCAEMGAAYPTRLEIREQGIVFAAGMPQIGTEPTRFVRLAPLSVASFAKPKPAHEQVPGEVAEVNTLHSDEGILEFDRPIASDRDMLTGKAKLIGIELRSNPDPHSTDPRNGRIVVTNNQRSADAGKSLVVKTPGPLFYRTVDHPEANNPAQPHIWTNAAVEIVNRENLPRPLHGNALPAVVMGSDDALLGRTVGDMALGLQTSPPTVTAIGLKLFMKRADVAPGKPKSGYSGIREMILSENVLFSLWIDAAAGFPGSEAKATNKSPMKESSSFTSALTGGLHDGRMAADRLKNKALLRIRTLGQFRYDLATNLACFEVAPQPNPLLPNNVEVMRLLPQGVKDDLVCQKLEIEFNGAIGGASEKKSTGPGFKKLLATGTHVLIAAATEQLQAQGTALYYETDTTKRLTRTVLRGAPLSAVRGKNVLIAGTAATPSELAITTTEPPQGSKETKNTDLAIRGPGRADLFDETSHEKTVTATWRESLEQTREIIDGIPTDRLTFTGQGEFIDAKGQFHLKGDVLKLWLKAGEKTANSSASKPYRMQALGHVNGTSADAIIENTDHLAVMFVDVAKPVTPASALPPTVAANTPPPLVAPPPKAPEKKEKDKPVRMSARLIDVTLHRPASTDPKAPSQYELHEAHCSDRVVVLQDPNDPKKAPVGIDIRGGGLLLKKRPNGHEMTVTGVPGDIARVRFENVTVCGPAVAIDQPNNSVAVTGAGWMRMPSSSDLAGGAIKEKGEITIHWQTRMKFLGERRWAEFVGQVQAVQAVAEGVVSVSPTTARTSVACHELNVTFDKPVYFDPAKKKGQPKAEGDPKVETVVCTPASEDGEAGAAGRQVLYLEETTDRATKKTVKAQQIEAKLLEVRVKEDRSLVAATGPGTTRILQMGTKETGPATPTNPNAKPETEMKLTLVRFSGRLDLEDRKGIFQKAVFREGVRVAQVPSENLQLAIEDTIAPPKRAMFLKCNDTFTVSSYRSKTPGVEDTRTMEALDSAEVKTDDYIGMGHKIEFDGEQVILRGYGDGQATLYRRQTGLTERDYKSGNPLIYNTKTGQVSGAQSSGGAFTTPK